MNAAADVAAGSDSVYSAVKLKSSYASACSKRFFSRCIGILADKVGPDNQKDLSEKPPSTDGPARHTRVNKICESRK